MENLDRYFLIENRGTIYSKVIGKVEVRLIEKALEHSFGNQIIASKILGINRNTLHSKIKKLNIDVTKFK